MLQRSYSLDEFIKAVRQVYTGSMQVETGELKGKNPKNLWDIAKSGAVEGIDKESAIEKHGYRPNHIRPIEHLLTFLEETYECIKTRCLEEDLKGLKEKLSLQDKDLTNLRAILSEEQYKVDELQKRLKKQEALLKEKSSAIGGLRRSLRDSQKAVKLYKEMMSEGDENLQKTLRKLQRENTALKIENKTLAAKFDRVSFRDSQAQLNFTTVDAWIMSYSNSVGEYPEPCNEEIVQGHDLTWAQLDEMMLKGEIGGIPERSRLNKYAKALILVSEASKLGLGK